MKHLQNLHISLLKIWHDPGNNDMLLHSLNRNSSLLQVTTGDPDDWSEADTAKKIAYAKRNAQIHAILEVPQESVELLPSLPRIFCASRGCEMESSVIFAALVALGESVGNHLRDDDAAKWKSEGPDNEEVEVGGSGRKKKRYCSGRPAETGNAPLRSSLAHNNC
jgi:hypothetical protein